jgi:hypothetical protein
LSSELPLATVIVASTHIPKPTQSVQSGRTYPCTESIPATIPPGSTFTPHRTVDVASQNSVKASASASAGTNEVKTESIARGSNNAAELGEEDDSIMLLVISIVLMILFSALFAVVIYKERIRSENGLRQQEKLEEKKKTASQVEKAGLTPGS